MRSVHSARGFSLIELLFATGLLLVVSSIVTTALMQMTNSQKTIWNRTEMHSGIRGATELLQQEVGQAGRIATPESVAPLTFATAVTVTQPSCDPAVPATGAVDVTISAVAGLWAFSTAGQESYAMLTTMDGNNSESFRVATITAGTPPHITACFTKTHAVGTVVMPLGAFATGIVPDVGVANGSNGSKLKMYGDINGDGNMVFVQYTCDTTNHKLYRKVVAFDVTPVNANTLDVTDGDILLANIQDNPGGTPCFTYQTGKLKVPPTGTEFNFVTDVAITLTVETEQVDPVTKQKQTETKALLNVSPRNVFHAWSFAGMGYTDRIQSTPHSVMQLICIGAAITCP